MRKLTILLPLILAACGTQVTPAAPDAQSEGKTFQQALQEPGWTETFPQYWERATDSGTESIYFGLSGARAALKVREAELRQVMAQGNADKMVQDLRAQVAELNTYVTTAEASGVAPQGSVNGASGDCRYAATVKPMVSAPGIRANAWITCSSARYPRSFATVNVAGTYGEEQEMSSETNSSASSSLASPTGTACSGMAGVSVTINGSLVATHTTGNSCR